MEVVSCHPSQCHYIANLKGGISGLNSHRQAYPIIREKGIFRVVLKSTCKPSKYSRMHNLKSKRIDHSWPSRTVYSINRRKHVNTSVLSETSSSGVLAGEEGDIIVAGSGQSIPKVLIPSLPDTANGNKVSPISSFFWEWKPNLNVHYETSGSENVNSPPLLFLPGFGVGSFHYEKQLKDLGRDYRAWALDFLGQGKSLPLQDPTSRSDAGSKSVLDGESNFWGFGNETDTWATDLVFSVDLWRDQVRYFIEEVIKEPVYLVGNSLGGFVALYFAASHPELVKGVTLLNATPFWGFLPNPARSPRFSRLFPWAGTFPLPSKVRKLLEIVWRKISDPKSIADILKQVYADHSTDVDDVFTNIVQTTQHPAAAASLASILCAPQAQLSFRETLSRCRAENIPVCLMYGKEDPWVGPMWGLQVKRALPDAPYYEISPAGHCPHDEVPEVVNYLIRGWIKNVESKGSASLPLVDDLENANVSKKLEFSRKGSKKSVQVQYRANTNLTFSWPEWLKFLRFKQA
ncbi:pheophytinase, chloroplastic [Dorcoceras hygrometricum]|uniref:Pheophytinase, chloroplastic n=1 Tax=Dorcoceras hygrometricum TaxID=472368 RepID=A0A2Z7BCM6_9LAMI|nr:pheophytinase, chloroplastic [Dorcoceras hygrometricum]